MRARTRTMVTAVGLAGLLVLGGCGDDEDEDGEELPPVTSLFSGGSSDDPTPTSPAISPTGDVQPSPGETSTTLDDARRRCTIDNRTLRTAQEAFYASKGRYAATDDELVNTGFLSEPSPLHDFEIVPAPPGGMMTFKLIVTSPLCGTPGHTVGQTPADI